MQKGTAHHKNEVTLQPGGLSQRYIPGIIVHSITLDILQLIWCQFQAVVTLCERTCEVNTLHFCMPSPQYLQIFQILNVFVFFLGFQKTHFLI